MQKRFNGKYEIYDGYVSGGRPQHFTVRPDEIEDGMCEQDLQALFDQLAKDHMREIVDVYKTNVDSFIEWAREVLAERSANAAADDR